VKVSLSVRLLVAAAILCSIGSVVRAQGPKTDLGLLSLEELMSVKISTATLVPEMQSDAPARVQVIPAAQIERRGYRSLLDVLKDLPDFKVDLRGNWDFPAEITVQGVRGATRVVVLLDGIRVSAPTNEPLPLVANYPVYNARQIEIVYGPVSAVHGADAFSAVINIITKDASEAAGLSVASSVGSFGLYNHAASYGTRVGTKGNLVVDGQFQYDRQPDLSRYYPDDFNGLQAQRTGAFPTAFGLMTPTDPVTPQYHIPMRAHALHATYRAGGLQLSAFENRSHLPTTAGVYTPDNVVYDDVAFNENQLIVGAGTYTRRLGRFASTSSVEFSRHELNPHSGYRDLYSNMNRSYKFAYGSMLKGEQQLTWNPLTRMTVTTGGTVERFFAIPQTADLNAPIRSTDEPGTILGTSMIDEFFELHYANVGAFAETRYAVAPSVTVTVGARHDYNTRYGSTINPRIGVVTRPTSTTTVKLLYGTAYLAPSPYQAYQHYGSFLSQDDGRTFSSPYWHLPNPDLRPQHKRTVEANVLQRMGPSVSVSASMFYSRFVDIIQATDPDETHTGMYHGWPVELVEFATNEGRQTTYGGTLGIDVVRSIGTGRQVSAYTGLSLVDGRIWPSDELFGSYPIGGMAPAQLKMGGDLDWGRFSAAATLGVLGRQRLSALTAGETGFRRQTIAGYSTSDITLRRRSVMERVNAVFKIENAFDRRYRTINERAYLNPEEFIGIPQNPRRISAGIELRLP
jgi:outer membrane cobalamin receptor